MLETQQSFSQVYSHYYDLIYHEKDYKKEAVQINKRIHQYQKNAKTILNIGCGTGNHDIQLARKDYQVTGIDSSTYMLKVANKKKAKEEIGSIQFMHKDICHDSFNEEFDVALSLFHVISYIITDNDLKSAFSNVYKSIRKGGLFIFDFWYAPGILANLPEHRMKLIEDGDVFIERHSYPEIDLKTNTVEVKFVLGIKNSKAEEVEMSSEIHRVRFYSIEEITSMLSAVGFEILGFGSDYEMRPFKKEDRYATVIAKK